MKIYENRNIEDLNGEIWKDIINFPDYQVSNFGRIKSFIKHNGIDVRILRQSVSKGYLFVRLSKNRKPKTKYIHILVFENFNNCKIKNNECIHHLNENKSDNILDNLQLMTKFEHTNKTKELMKKNHANFKGKNHPQVKIKEKQVIQIKMLFKLGFKSREVMKITEISKYIINDIKRGKTWKHIII